MEAKNQIPEYVIAYLHGEATEEQTGITLEWLRLPENHKIFNQLESISRLTTDLRHLDKFNLYVAKQKVKSKRKADHMRRLVAHVQRIAAILIIPLLLGGFWLYMKEESLRKRLNQMNVMQEVINQPGTKTHFFLPDGTEVWMNAASRLKFPTAFVGQSRNVELDGEAYFKVFHNKQMPFVVKTKYLNVEALGTSFNLLAYSDDYKISTTLEEGKVRVRHENTPNKSLVLTPGVQLNYDILNQEYKSEQVKVEDIIAWKDGILIFNETPFIEVVSKLGRWFNADIKITDQSIQNYRFTGTFTNESLDQVLQLLTLTTPIAYSSSDRKTTDNKTFSKQEIKIWKK